MNASTICELQLEIASTKVKHDMESKKYTKGWKNLNMAPSKTKILMLPTEEGEGSGEEEKQKKGVKPVTISIIQG